MNTKAMEDIPLKNKQVNSIDINCDLGEGMPCDVEIMPYISSCSIACGGHAGDEASMRKTIALAAQHQLKIGAHPSYPDKENFGRRSIFLSKDILFSSLRQQIHALHILLQEHDIKMHHVKPHGALYNDAARDAEIAKTIVAVMQATVPKAKLYAPYASVLAEVARQQAIDVMYEVFADRNYQEDLSLVSRKHPNALIHAPDASYQHVKRMLIDQEVLTLEQAIIPIQAETICVHSDTHEAVAIVAQLHARLTADNILIQ